MKKLRKFIISCFFISLFNIFFIYDVKAEDIVKTSNLAVSYETHAQDIGWTSNLKSNKFSGTIGQALKLKGIKISLANPISGAKIKYQVHVENTGWMPWVYDGQATGRTEDNLRIEAIRVALEGASNYSVLYQVHVQDYGWMDWTEDGQVAGTIGKSLRVEAIRIKIIKNNLNETSNMNVKYQSFVEKSGWQTFITDGEYSGTVGRSLRLEAIKISLLNSSISDMKIKYKVHVQDIGWMPWVKTGELAGTTGKSKRLEAIAIELEGAPEGVHVQYQVHVENIGWMPWVQDGAAAGTEGRSLRIEAIRIKIAGYSDLNRFVYNDINYNITLEDHVQAQYNRGPVVGNTSTKADIDTVKYYLKPESFEYNEQKYQFMKLDAYSDIISESNLNKFLAGKGVFDGQAKLFLDAAKNNNINPLYLVAHAMWETAYGNSALSKGIYVEQVNGQPVEPKTAYNFFGIGAPDGNANRAGSENAYLRGWFSPKLAIDGGAEWIKANYIHSTRTNQLQNTLYEMRWNYMVNWHQYATDVRWAYGITSVINKMLPYTDGAKFVFEKPIYK